MYDDDDDDDGDDYDDNDDDYDEMMMMMMVFRAEESQKLMTEMMSRYEIMKAKLDFTKVCTKRIICNLSGSSHFKAHLNIVF